MSVCESNEHFQFGVYFIWAKLIVVTKNGRAPRNVKYTLTTIYRISPVSYKFE